MNIDKSGAFIVNIDRKAEIRSSRDNLHQQQGMESRPGSAAPKMFRPRSSKNVSSNKLSPVLKQIMNKKIQSEQGELLFLLMSLFEKCTFFV